MYCIKSTAGRAADGNLPKTSVRSTRIKMGPKKNTQEEEKDDLEGTEAFLKNTKEENKEDPEQSGVFLNNTQEENKGDPEEPKVDVIVPANDYEAPDGGWGWLVCLASFWVNGSVLGLINSFGIIFPKLLETYGKNDPSVRFKTSWVGSITVGMLFFTSILASILTDKIGIRKTGLVGVLISVAGLLGSSMVEQLQYFYLTYGFLLGCGSSLVYTPSLIILGHYFKKRLGLVNGFVTFGSAVFTMALPYMLKHSLSSIGFKHTFYILSGISATQVFCVLTWRPLLNRTPNKLPVSPESDTEAGQVKKWLRKILNVHIWRNKQYVVWIIGLAIAMLGFFPPYVHLIKFVQETFPNADGEILLVALGATSGVSRLITGKLSDFDCASRVRMHQAAFAVMGVCIICIPFAPNYWILLAICIVLGVCGGTVMCLVGAIAFELVGPKNGSQAVGFVLGAESLPIMFGPPIAGFLYDKFGNYNAAFWFSGAPPLVGAAVMFLIRRQKQPPDSESNCSEICACKEESLGRIQHDVSTIIVNEPQSHLICGTQARTQDT